MDEKLQLLLQEDESLIVEFKERFSSKIDKDIVTFSNTKGGKIFLGVGDQGEIIGEVLTNELKAKINNLARNCEPAIAVSIQQFDRVVIVTVGQSDVKPHCCATGYYRRLDATTQKMNQKELKLLFDLMSGRSKFELLSNDEITWDDISLVKLKSFLQQVGIALENISPKHLFDSLRLAQNNKISNADILFFAKEPRRFITHCEMILVAFKDGEGTHIYDRVNTQDDLVAQFHEAMTFLKKDLNLRSEITGISRHDIYEIPLAALREAVVNAIIHHDYSVAGTSLLIEVYEDRVVIKNPGSLLPGVSVNTLTQISIRRNEIIADLFARIDKTERIVVVFVVSSV